MNGDTIEHIRTVVHQFFLNDVDGVVLAFTGDEL